MDFLALRKRGQSQTRGKKHSIKTNRGLKLIHFNRNERPHVQNQPLCTNSPCLFSVNPTLRNSVVFFLLHGMAQGQCLQGPG